MDFTVLFTLTTLYANVFKSSAINAINNGSACSVLFLSTTGLFLARRKILEHET